MISIFKKVKEPYSEGGSGDGTKANPWYWHSLGGTDTVSVNNTNANPADDCRLYFRIKLKGGTAYNISQTAPGGSDGRIYLYDESWNVLDDGDDTGDGDATLDDTVSYTPSADCICYVGAGNYSGDEGLGNYLVRVSPLPEYEAPPNSKLIYTTSSGFDEFGYPVRFDTAVEAGCNFNVIPEDGLVFYASLKERSDTAETGQTLDQLPDYVYETYQGVPCLQIKGSTSGLQSNMSSADFSDKALTVSYALNSSYTGTYIGLFYFSGSRWMAFNATGGDFITIKINGGSPRVQIQNFVGSQQGFHRDGNWHIYTHIITEGSQKTYVDGVLYATSSYTGISFPSGSSSVYIGDSGDGDYMQGSRMAAFRVYNRALNENEILKLSKEFRI